METKLNLQDIGEFSYIENHLKPILGEVSKDSSFGSDCSLVSLEINHSNLVSSADVGPRPISWKLIGGEDDYLTYGYYSVLVNASDLATEGATPVGYLNSTEAPAQMKISHLDDFFSGVKEA
ncbi:MAG: hypothetical protein EOO88_44860, partial [Pedobacter sp.]